MISMKSKSTTSLIVIASLLITSAVAKPTRVVKPIPSDIPNLNDALTVAKSPLEPVTLEPSHPDGRNTNADLNTSEKTTTEGGDQPVREKLTTAEPDEQERDSTTLADQSLGDVASDQSATTTTAPVTTFSTTSTTVQPTTRAIELSSTTEAVTETDAATETELETTTIVSVIKSNPITVPPISSSSNPTTVQPSTAESATEQQPASSEAPETSTSGEERREEKTTTTTAAPTTTLAPSPESISLPAVDDPVRDVVATNIKDDKETNDTELATEAPVATDQPKVISDATPAPASEQPSSQPATVSSTTVASETEAPATSQPTTTSTTTETPISNEPTSSTTTTTTTTTLKVATVESSPSSTVSDTPSTTDAEPVTPVVTSITSTTSAPLVKDVDESNKKTNDEEKQQSCNHLPTYGTDEIQKVFREETTYRNGTIKGKFTYLNYDMRYRLVHYTRLPYGPVKIDLVEELGRASSGAANQSYSLTSLEDIPNAGLQLRNILPNSLFGFPFLGPNNQPQNQPKPASAAQINGLPQQQREFSNDNQELDRSNMYFYSIDTISTPNLLTPSVPVSVLPNQRRQLDVLASPPVGSAQHVQDNASEKRHLDQGTSNNIVPSSHANFQYAAQQPPVVSGIPLLQAGPEVKPHVSTYSHLAQAHQYQYSPVPLYTFQQPSYYSSVLRHQSAMPVLSQPLTANLNKLKPDQTTASATDPLAIPHHQTHQPHGHEHYIAPFMFSQQPGLHVNDQTEASRLKLRVKTSKSLSQEPSGKSAQLRAAPSAVYSTPINSPAQNRRMLQQQQQTKQQPRHRLGKQNQELKQTVNQTPVVYHVLRSPVGRMYTLPQYNQAHAMAYDHDD